MRRLAVVVVSLVVVAACSRAEPIGDPDKAKPDTKLEQALNPLRGSPVVVNFWATWCIPCKDEMPRLVDAAEEYKGRVSFLGVNVEDDLETAAKFAKRYKVPFRSISDPNGEIRRSERVLGLPVTQFYDAEGELSFVHHGEIKDDQLEEKIEEVLRVSV